MYNLLETRHKVKTISESKELIKNLKEDRLFEYMEAGICALAGAGFLSFMALEEPTDIQAAIALYLGSSIAIALSTFAAVESIKESHSISKDIGAIEAELNSMEESTKTR